MKKIIIAAAAAATIAISPLASFAAEKPVLSVPAASGDVQLSEGRWTELAARYPIPSVSGDIKNAPTPEILSSWWDSLGDETLTQLIRTALENNRDLASARSRVTEARYALGISKAALLPWLDSTNFWSKSRTPVEAGGSGRSGEMYKLGIDASWEIDIFGGRRQTVKASMATLEAQYAALNSAWVSLSSEVAVNYISLRTLQQRLIIAKDNLALQQDTLNMLQSRYDAGLSNALALSQAQYTLEQTRSSIPPIETNIEATKNGLAVLTGLVPGALEETLREAQPIPQADMSVMVGIPANALRQRPDIRAAERRLVAQIARKKSAQADLWPKFYLVGSIGTESLTSGSLFEGPNKLYSFGPQITFPIFHWGAIRKNIKVQRERQAQALNTYEQTVITAVSEVRNAITAALQERQRNASLKTGVEAARTALDVANDQYRNGLVDFNNVISAQRALLSLSELYVNSSGQITTDAVQLFKALGGGWAPISAEYSQEEETAKK